MARFSQSHSPVPTVPVVQKILHLWFFFLFHPFCCWSVRSPRSRRRSQFTCNRGPHFIILQRIRTAFVRSSSRIVEHEKGRPCHPQVVLETASSHLSSSPEHVPLCNDQESPGTTDTCAAPSGLSCPSDVFERLGLAGGVCVCACPELPALIAIQFLSEKRSSEVMVGCGGKAARITLPQVRNVRVNLAAESNVPEPD